MSNRATSLFDAAANLTGSQDARGNLTQFLYDALNRHTVTIDALSKEPYKVPANRQIKTLIYIADSKPIIILIRGDDQLNETKLLAKTGAVAARPATVEEIVPLLGAKPGSLGALKTTLPACRRRHRAAPLHFP